MSRYSQYFLIFISIIVLWNYYQSTKRLDVCRQILRDEKNTEKQKSSPGVVVEKSLVPRSYCTGTSAEYCVAPLVEFKQRYRTASKYKLLGCAIEKNFSTMLTAILCYLHNEEKFIKYKRTLVKEMFHKRFCGPINEQSSLQQAKDKYSISTKADWSSWMKIAIVRNPLDRFVSGFTDKCRIEQTWKEFPSRCNSCKTNLTCFMEKQYNRMMKKATREKIRANFDDDHFYPQSWRCEFSSHLHDFSILQFDSDHPQEFVETLLTKFKENNVTEKSISFIRDSLQSGRTEHSTVGSKEREKVHAELTGNPHLMELLIQMYYYDFVLFGFELPKIPENPKVSIK